MKETDIRRNILAAGSLAAMLDGVVLLIRSAGAGPLSDRMISAGAAALGAFFLTVTAALLVSLVVRFLGGPSPAPSLAAGIRGLWCGPSGNGDHPTGTRLMEMALRVAFAFGLMFSCALWVTNRFHESTRISLLLALLAVPLVAAGTPLARRLTAILGRGFPRLEAPLSRTTGRIGVSLVAAIGAGTIVVTGLMRQEIFGAIDVAWILPALVFVLLVLFPMPVLRRETHLPGFITLAIPLVSLGLFLGILAWLPGARGPLRSHGALGAKAQSLLTTILDFDGDGSPWLLGGDCHPFDETQGPFAVDVPGNGIDENCDGTDGAAAPSLSPDPLSSLGPVPDSLRNASGNVLLIILDANGAGHHSLYGYERETTPHLNQFARDAVVFDNFFAVANHTGIAMPAILAGRYPSAIPGADKVDWGSFRVKGPIRNLLVHERLKKRGYHTANFAGHGMLGFIQGFDDLYRPRDENYESASVIARVTRAALEKTGPTPDQPAFMIAHFIDGHHPYKPHPDMKAFGRSDRDRYDGELAYVDRELAPILEMMNQDGYRDWLVIVTSDHGEAFGEHGTKHHGSVLYDEETRVPLVLRVPGAAPERRKLACGHMDLVPTILDWVGAPITPDLDGKSLLPLIDTTAEPPGPRYVFSEFFRRGKTYAAHDGRHSMIYYQSDDRYELFDTKTDPAQRHNLFHQTTAPPIKAALDAHVAQSVASFARALQSSR